MAQPVDAAEQPNAETEEESGKAPKPGVYTVVSLVVVVVVVVVVRSIDLSRSLYISVMIGIGIGTVSSFIDLAALSMRRPQPICNALRQLDQSEDAM